MVAQYSMLVPLEVPNISANNGNMSWTKSRLCETYNLASIIPKIITSCRLFKKPKFYTPVIWRPGTVHEQFQTVAQTFSCILRLTSSMASFSGHCSFTCTSQKSGWYEGRNWDTIICECFTPLQAGLTKPKCKNLRASQTSVHTSYPLANF